MPADEPDVIGCVNAAYQKYVAVIGRMPAPMLADYPRLIASGHVRVAVSGESIVGVIVMWPEPDHLYIDNVAVLPEAQGRGIGRVLLDAADDAAVERGHHEIRLYTNEAMTANLGYYPRRGYLETHRAEADGYQRVYFSRRLP
jgi:ribosomal protein S18 acetylase RimI-like enzyme